MQRRACSNDTDRSSARALRRVLRGSALAAAVLAAGSATGEPKSREPVREAGEPVLEQPVLAKKQGAVVVTLPELGSCTAGAPLELESGARLSLPAGASVSGVCRDLRPFEASGPLRDFEPCSAPVKATGVSPLAPLRGDVPAHVPRLLWPRSSYVRQLGRIEWRPVPGEAEYTVALRDDRAAVLWIERVTTARARYPESAPKLEPGRWYEVRVAASRNDSSEEPADLGFQLLSESAREQVARAENRLGATALTPALADFVHGLLLRRFRLHGEALERFAGEKGAAARLALAQTKIAIGLTDEAVTVLGQVRAASPPGSCENGRAVRLLRSLGAAPGEGAR